MFVNCLFFLFIFAYTQNVLQKLPNPDLMRIKINNIFVLYYYVGYTKRNLRAPAPPVFLILFSDGTITIKDFTKRIIPSDNRGIPINIKSTEYK